MATSSIPSSLQLSDLWIYPLKSAQGLRLQQAEVTSRGLRHDRRWMLVDPAGQFISQRSCPQLGQMAVQLNAQALSFSWPTEDALQIPLPPYDLPERAVRVWDSEVQAQCFGTAVNAWFSACLQQPVQLVYLPDAVHRATSADFAPGYEVGFADGYPYLITLSSSLDALNQRLLEPVTMVRFRPNLVISGPAPAWSEDHWQVLQIGSHTFQPVKPCGRCVMIGGAALKALALDRRQRDGLIFGQNAICQQNTGWLREGQPVQILL